MINVSVGLPVTVTASSIVTVAVTTSPAFNVLFCAPVAEVMATEETVGGVLSADGGSMMKLLVVKLVEVTPGKKTAT